MSIISTRLLISDKKRQFLDLKIGNAVMQKVTRMETSQVSASAFKTLQPLTLRYTLWPCHVISLHVSKALVMVNVSHFHCNAIQDGCEAVLGRNKIARNCLIYIGGYITMHMRKLDCERGNDVKTVVVD